MTFEQALAYLDSFVNYELAPKPAAMREIKLERMRRLCQRLGDPHRRFRSILVAGTNGKGSICAMLHSMLRETSLQIGLYTSPHLESVRERIQVSNSAAERGATRRKGWIAESEFAALVRDLRPLLEELRRIPQEAPTHFEVLTAMAFLYFQKREVEVAVLEVGLGGRLDATNVVEPDVSVISAIDIDHTEILGYDPVLIAREKAGIIRAKQTVIIAPQQAAIEEVFRIASETNGVPLWVCGRDLTVRVHGYTLKGLQLTVTGFRGIYESVQLPLLGRHQADNAAVAIGALEALSGDGIPHALVMRGLSRVVWPGRLEVMHENPPVFMDGAHNPSAARALRDMLTELCPGRAVHLLLGISREKAVDEFGKILGRMAVSTTCAKSGHPRAMDPQELSRRIAQYCPTVHVITDPVDALTYLLNTVQETDVIVVTGSLFFVGELRTAFRRAHVRLKRTAIAG